MREEERFRIEQGDPPSWSEVLVTCGLAAGVVVLVVFILVAVF